MLTDRAIAIVSVELYCPVVPNNNKDNKGHAKQHKQCYCEKTQVRVRRERKANLWNKKVFGIINSNEKAPFSQNIIFRCFFLSSWQLQGRGKARARYAQLLLPLENWMHFGGRVKAHWLGGHRLGFSSW